MKKRFGFTLIELITTVMLFSIFAAAVFWTFVVGLRVWSSGRDRAEIRQSGNIAIEKMVRELSLASEFKETKSDKVKFEADLNGDGSVEEIKFDTDKDGNLVRKKEKPNPKVTVILARNVQSFTVGYYLESDNENLLSKIDKKSRDDIRVVVVSLSINEGDETINLSSSAYIRNQGLDD